MMDAVEFMDEYGRMCAYYEDCEQFPARKLSKCRNSFRKSLNGGQQNPQKRGSTNYGGYSLKMSDYTAGCKDWKNCEECRRAFWNAEV